MKQNLKQHGLYLVEGEDCACMNGVQPPRTLRFTEDKANDIDLTSFLHELWRYRRYYDHARIKTLWAELRLVVNVAAVELQERIDRGDIPQTIYPEP